MKYSKVFVTNITQDTNTDMGYGVWLHHVICDCKFENGETEKQAYRIFSKKEYVNVITKGYFEVEEFDSWAKVCALLNIDDDFHMCDIYDISEQGVFLESWNTLVPIADFEDIKNLILNDAFDITDFKLVEIPHPHCFCFFNAKTSQSFDVAKFWDDKWQFSYTSSTEKGFMSMKAETISEAVNNYEEF